MDKLFCVFKIVIGPLSKVSFWGEIRSGEFLKALGNSLYFPRGFSLVVTLFHNKRAKDDSSFFVRAGLKLRRSNLTESAVKDKLETSLREFFLTRYNPSVRKVPLRVKGRKESGWNRRCQRLLTAEGRGPTCPTVSWSILPEDLEEFMKVLNTFERGGKK